MSQTAPNPFRDRNYRVRAIVIDRSDLGEADRIYTVFSQERGKIRAVAKGVRKPKSKIGPGLEYFCTSDLQLTRGRGLDIITSATIVDRPFSAGHSVESIGYVSHLAEMTSRMTVEEQEAREIFELLSGAIAAIDLGIDPNVVVRSFELGLLKQSGYNIDLYRCSACGNSLQEVPNILSPLAGGFVCQNCRSSSPPGRLMSVQAQKYLRVVDRQGIQAASRLNVKSELMAELDQAMRDFLRTIIEREPSSLRVLEEMRETTARYDSG